MPARGAQPLPQRSGHHLGEHLPDGAADGQCRLGVAGGGAEIDDCQVFAVKIIHQPRRGIDRKLGAADEQHIRGGDGLHRRREGGRVQALTVKDHIRLDDAAAGAAGHVVRLQHRLHRPAFAALHAVIAVHAAVQFQHVAAARPLMEFINVLGDDRRQLALLFQARQRIVRRIGLCLRADEIFAVVIEKHVRVTHKKAVAEQFLRRPSVRLQCRINAVAAAEVGNAAFGGNLYEVVVGGAPFNQEVEAFLKSIDFPITVGYGATECAPIITYTDWSEFVPTSCGKAVMHMEVKIDSPDPQNVPGEILARGTNTMLGYYKNEQATSLALDREGWYHTGDLALMDEDGYVFIKGRSKNMLLGANGQNIYPEEIEDKLNSMTLVVESLVIQNGDKLAALIYPDYDEAKNLGFSKEDLQHVMEQNLIELNQMIPSYSKVSSLRLQDEEFEKTPKKSIKRYLYKDVEL